VDPEGRHLFFFSRAVVLATGGCGQLYRYTTQPVECTGDGLAMAYRAGAILADLEFIQFHPTALACQQNPLPLISEAVRGEGAHLVNQRNQQFMAGIHPREELAPRDIVARSVYRQVSQGNQVFLDISNLEESFPLRFPNIHRSCLEHGIDLQSNLLPVSPAAHFIMGGVYTDLQGQTSLKGLFAVGETACTGVHGGNRLASNSLLEGIVFAHRVAGNLPLNPDGQLNTASLSWPHHLLQHSSLNQTLEQRPDEDIPTPVPDQPRKALQNLMWEQVGLIRNRHQLTSAREALTQMDRETPPQIIELHNMLTVARGITRGALARTESRGSHLREDYPHPSPLWAGQRIPYRRC
jgi:L-aspartate oxidase